jgi:hypothetical protein
MEDTEFKIKKEKLKWRKIVQDATIANFHEEQDGRRDMKAETSANL